MRWILILIFLICAPVEAEELWLRVGEIRTLPAPTGRSVRIAGHGIVKVVDGDTTIQVIGLKPGTTTVAIGTRAFTVHVNLRRQKDFAIELRRRLKTMMGLELQSDTQTLMITGTLLRWSDWQEIADLSRQLQGEYSFAARALPDVAEQALTFFNTLAREKGLPVARFRADPVFTVQLPKAPGLKESASLVFKSYGMNIETSVSDLMLQPLVRTKVILAEISRDESQELGVAWPSEYQAQVLPKLAANADGLMVSLKALETQGRAQILASPNLLCRSGSEAKFHAGGEFPIRVYSRSFHDITWKQHGVLLRVKPLADFQGAISLEIETEVSILDQANAVEGIPALKSNNVKSHFDLPGRRTIALSGLLRQEMDESSEGLPYLQRLPVLGRLFSSKKYLKHQSELVIFVTPEIYVPESDEKIQMPEGWVKNAF